MESGYRVGLIQKNKFTFKYGRVDVRAKLPVPDGMFSAI
jgi:beta-glucanase (GH16 family)